MGVSYLYDLQIHKEPPGQEAVVRYSGRHGGSPETAQSICKERMYNKWLDQ